MEVRRDGCTVVGFRLSVQDLCPAFPPIGLKAASASASASTSVAAATAPVPMSIRVVTMLQRQEDLHEITPHRILRNRLVIPSGVEYDSGKIAAAAIIVSHCERLQRHAGSLLLVQRISHQRSRLTCLNHPGCIAVPRRDVARYRKGAIPETPISARL
jgi:hypothetical protein